MKRSDKNERLMRLRLDTENFVERNVTLIKPHLSAAKQAVCVEKIYGYMASCLYCEEGDEP